MRRPRRVPESPCPVCAYLADAVVSPDPNYRRPRPGEYTLCGRCAAVLKFGAGMQLERVTLQELAAFAAEDPEHYDRMRELQGFILTD